MLIATAFLPELRVMETDAGVRFGVWGTPGIRPAPTLFILANTIEETLGDDYFRQCGTRVAAAGTSRGGFLALHFTAFDRRVRCVAAFAPVTDLAALWEFKGAEANALLGELAVVRQADRLTGRGVWISIGDRDERVGTDNVIATARRLTAAALTLGLTTGPKLHVLPEPHHAGSGTRTGCSVDRR